MNVLPATREKIDQKISAVAAIGNEMPGIIIIHNRDLFMEYLSPKGEKLIGHTLEELRQMGPAYFQRFFQSEGDEDYVPKIIGMLQRKNIEESVSYFQKVWLSESWIWHISNTKILLQDEAGEVLLFITFSTPIDPQHHLTGKVNRLIEENDFLRRNYASFATLGKREVEVLRLLAMGKSNSEIAAGLFISASTVETHRRNIRQKLHAGSLFELIQYARSFDLI